MARWILVISILVFCCAEAFASNAPTCYSGSDTLQWYTNAIGETPCATYQRLRQICNSDYTTPTWAIDTPTDQCDDPLNTCCCNSIAWSIRMLCINCEWDEFGVNDPGHSGVAGNFYQYRWSTGVPNNGVYCGDGYNQTLPDTLQQAVCDRGIHVGDFLYSIFWPDGSWNFTAFETLAKDILASHNNQSLDSCTENSSTAAAVTSTITLLSTAPAQLNAVAKVDTAAVVGGSLGGALGLVLLGAIITTLYVKRRHLQHSRPVVAVTTQGGPYSRSPANPGMDMGTHLVTPFLGQSSRRPPSEETPQCSPLPGAPHSGTHLISNGLYTPPSTNVDASKDVRTYSNTTNESVRTQLPPEYRTVYSSE